MCNSEPNTTALDIITRWIWGPGSLTSRIVEVRGGQMPNEVRQEFAGSGPDPIGPTHEACKKAEIVAHTLAQLLPEPAPLDLGGKSKITGAITGIQLVDSRTSENPNHNYISTTAEYTNGTKTQPSKTFRLEELPEHAQKLVIETHRLTNEQVKTWFWQRFGEGTIAPEKWKPKKTEVFISYRSGNHVIATRIFDGLGQFANSGAFIPRLDAVDLQAGNWMDQLISMVSRAPVFVPILSNDYLQGPIARPELDLAMREAFANGQKRIVPVLVEGRPEDYLKHFIGAFHMVNATAGITEGILKEIAYLALGISRNRYE